MIRHQTKPVNPAVEFFNDALQQQVKSITVVIREKDALAGIATEDYVINGSWIMDARFACHGAIIAKNGRKSSLTP